LGGLFQFSWRGSHVILNAALGCSLSGDNRQHIEPEVHAGFHDVFGFADIEDLRRGGEEGQGEHVRLDAEIEPALQTAADATSPTMARK